MAMSEHEWKCTGQPENVHEDGTTDAHETVSVVTSATFGTDPRVPLCTTCGQPMKKVFSAPLVNYDRDWYMRR